MFSPTVRLIVGVFAASGGLVQLFLTVRALWQRIWAQRHTPQAAARPLWSEEIREGLLRGTLGFTLGTGVALGSPYLGYVVVLDTPLMFVWFIWMSRRVQRHQRSRDGRS